MGNIKRITPRPWKLEGPFTTTNSFDVRGPLGEFIASVNYANRYPGPANARFIITACNLHDELVDVLKMAKEFMEIASDWNFDEAEINGRMRSTYDWIADIEAVLAKAEGGE